MPALWRDIDLPEDGDPWMWFQECYHCQQSTFTVMPALDARRRFGPAAKNFKACRKLIEYSVQDETDRLLAKIAKDLDEVETDGLVA